MEAGAVGQALRELGEGDLESLARLADRTLGAVSSAPGGPGLARTRPGRGLEFLEYRDYVAGDDPRFLDWRASARRRHPQVRQFADEAHGRWFVCLDRSPSMAYPDDGKWTLAVQLAAAWAYLLIHAGHRVGLVTFDDQAVPAVPLGRGRTQYRKILAELATTLPANRGAGTCLAACRPFLGRSSCAAVVSDFLTADSLVQDLDLLRAELSEAQVLQVTSPLEHLPGLAGPATLVDAETGERRFFSPAGETSGEAESRAAALKARLSAHCLRKGIRLTQCLAGENWASVLLRHLVGSRSSRA